MTILVPFLLSQDRHHFLALFELFAADGRVLWMITLDISTSSFIALLKEFVATNLADYSSITRTR